jgi:phosphopantothenoylcysteine decarboxylase/phosphopantothenate--cysteine ligase
MLVIGFAAETANVLENATQKRLRKCCDWMLANDVSLGTGTFGGSRNTVHLISDGGEIQVAALVFCSMLMKTRLSSS